MKDVLRATVVLNTRPLPEREKEIAAAVVEQYGEEDTQEFVWELMDELPDDLSVNVADQLAAHKRDAGANSCYMLVWMR